MRRKISLILSVFICLVLTGCNEPAQIVDCGFYFDTYVQIHVYGEDKQYLKECLEICESCDKLYSAHDPDSLLYKLNHGESSDYSALYPLIKTSKDYNDLTGGAVNPAIGAVSLLWDFSDKDNPSFPGSGNIKDALIHTDPSSIILKDNNVSLTDPEAKIDLGFIAKGAVSELIRDHLIEKGVKSALINLGGNIVVIGSKPGGEAFTVGIKYPFSGDVIVTVEVCDAAVVTSGIYERNFVYNDHFYHHILDPETGFPVENELLSVTIVSSDPTKADALSTACMVMGMEKGLEFIENTDDAEALFIDNHYNIYTTSGFPKYEYQ